MKTQNGPNARPARREPVSDDAPAKEQTPPEAPTSSMEVVEEEPAETPES